MITREQAEKMTDEEMRIAVAKACGWKSVLADNPNGLPHTGPCGCPPGSRDECLSSFALLPNYPASLDACHEAIQAIPEAKKEDFLIYLERVCSMSQDWDYKEGRSGRWFDFILVNATARQRCIAFLMTVG